MTPHLGTARRACAPGLGRAQRLVTLAVLVALGPGCRARVSAEIVLPEEPAHEPRPTVVETPGAELSTPAEPPPPPETEAIAQLRAIPFAGGSGEWDDEVRVILLAHYDRDSSGTLDREDELRAITCEVYGALDEAVNRDYGNSLGVIYGFGPDYMWVGSTLGFDEGLRPLLAGAVESCGLDIGA